ncbi:MAG: arginine--tRNA ligase, partial [Myxococcales bacterium]|nr:arginine--tRNA ligase [Myxococcales bacterium]
MATYHTPLHRAAAEAVCTHAGITATDLKVEAPPRPELGDLAVGCFAIAKAQRQSPAEVARANAAAFQPTELLESATAAGPFVNFRARRAPTLRWLIDGALRSQLIPYELGAGKTICIDYGSPNISKHLAYHHIRGTTIGHALAQTFRALGYRVVGINFLGDWGTTHGMLLAAWAKWGPLEHVDITALNALYVRFRAGMKEDPALEQEGRAWFKKLEDGDPEARALWQRFRDVSWAEFQSVYEILGIDYDEVRGESAYEPDMPRVFEALAANNLTTVSDGALVVELEGEKNPILLRTRDGTTLYATRDVAAAEYRWTQYQFTRSLYVVDRGQALHFRQLFKLLGKMGHDWAPRCEHVPYGLVKIDNQRAATRLGNVVLMREVFTIAENLVRTVIAENNPEMDSALVGEVARQVGIGAMVFANLAPQRDKDIDFDIDHAVSLDGDSGPYLQYSHARCASIARKGGERITSLDGIDLERLGHDAEWAVARKLLEFPDVVVRSSEGCEPHIICHYLLQLAAEFSRWYTAGNGDASLRVLCDDVPTRRARLALVAALQATLRDGLS